MENNPVNTGPKGGELSNGDLVRALVLVQYSDPLGHLLSNLAETPFTLDGVKLNSVEALIQGCKFHFVDPRRESVFTLSGLPSKRAGKEVSEEFARRFVRGEVPNVYWDGKEIPFGAMEHRELIRRAIMEKFLQNLEAQNALKLTGNALLIHPIPDAPYTSLKAAEFVGILSAIREELLASSAR